MNNEMYMQKQEGGMGQVLEQNNKWCLRTSVVASQSGGPDLNLSAVTN